MGSFDHDSMTGVDLTEVDTEKTLRDVEHTEPPAKVGDTVEEMDDPAE